MLKVAIGHSDDINSVDAIEQVLSQCNDSLNGFSAHAGMLFCSIDQDFQSILNKINETYPGIELIGCTTDGEFSSVLGFAEDSILLILFHSDDCEWKAGIGRQVSDDPIAIVEEAVKSTISQLTLELRLCIVTPDSLTSSADSILQGLRNQLGANLPILGGTAGDQLRLKKTFQFYKNEVLSDSAPFILFSGPISLSFGVESGWKPVGKKGKVTRVENNILYQIDNIPATDYYQHYLNIELSDVVSEYPLAVYVENEENYYLRNPLFFNKENGSIAFMGDIPINATVQITHVERDGIIKATEESANIAINNFKGSSAKLALCFSCAGRKLVLGTRTHEEFQIFEKQNSELMVAGFYSYGEIAPLEPNTLSRFHNETFITLMLGDE